MKLPGQRLGHNKKTKENPGRPGGGKVEGSVPLKDDGDFFLLRVDGVVDDGSEEEGAAGNNELHEGELAEGPAFALRLPGQHAFGFALFLDFEPVGLIGTDEGHEFGFGGDGLFGFLGHWELLL